MTIDRAKGIIAKPMPEYWYSIRENVPKKEDAPETRAEKEFNKRIAAANKPYFMIYVYQTLKSKYDTYVKNNNLSAAIRFSEYGINGVEDLRNYERQTSDMQSFVEYYDRYMPVGENACLVNRICWLFEKEFSGFSGIKKGCDDFDYTIMKSNVEYSKKTYDDIFAIYRRYQDRMDAFQRKARTENIDSDTSSLERGNFFKLFRMECECVCPNEDELCDIVLDLCYKTERSKQFAWDVSGEVILRNLLQRHNNVIRYPVQVDENGEFEYCGEQFVMCEAVIGGEDFADNIE